MAFDESLGSDLPSLPARTGPLMLAHLALTRDVEQHRQWRGQVEEIRRLEAVEAATEPQRKALLKRRAVWARMRRVGAVATAGLLPLAAAWTALTAWMYAVPHGFGWLAGLSFLLPLPLAWWSGRALWQRASLRGMASLGRRPSVGQRLAGLAQGVFSGFCAGFGFGFVLVFLQGLLTWFMTPADTLVAEVLLDALFAARLGLVTGVFGGLMAPLVSMPEPDSDALELGSVAPRSLAPGG